MPTVPIPDLGKGVNKDALPAELDLGFWSDCVNFRFRNGFAESFEGVPAAVTASVAAYWCLPYITPAAVSHIVYSGLAKAYTSVDNASTEITRYTDGAAISSITRVGTTATLTTATNHGRTTNDVASVWGASPSQYNVSGVAITVTSPTTFTYTMASDPGSSATLVGEYSYNVTSDFTATADNRITGGILGGIVLYNSPVNGLYYWAGDTTIRLRKVPLAYLADVSRPFKNYIVQLAPTIGGVKYPYDVVWSSSAEPGALPTAFTASSTNDAGRSPSLAETGGHLMDCLPLGDVLILYKQDARYLMQYIGGNDVFRFQRLPGNDGLLAPQCVVETPKGHVFLTQNVDVMIHQGGEARSIAEGIVRNWIRSNIAITGNGPSGPLQRRAFLAVYEAKREVWVCFPNGASACNSVAVWNWESDSWGILDLSARPLTNAASGLLSRNAATFKPTTHLLLCAPYAAAGTNAELIGALDGAGTPTTYFGSTLTKTLERTGMHFGDRDTFKAVQRSRWNIEGTAGETASVYHGTSKTADGSITYTNAATYTVGTTDYVDARSTSGRFGAIKLTTTSLPRLRVRSDDLDVTGGGKR